MHFGNLSGRATIFRDGLAYDVAALSGDSFSDDPMQVLFAWDDFRDWAARAPLTGGRPFEDVDLGAPAPRPGQIFAIGLNYRDHAAEAGLPLPGDLTVFTKFASSLTGPVTEVSLSGPSVDWEAELVVVIGRTARRVSAEEAWSYVAGVTVGQDISDRAVQTAGPVPQFSLGKSFAGYSPVGPWLVTPDELADPDDLVIETRVSGLLVQRGRTSDMVFGVSEAIARLSRIVTLHAGDLIFTGTPAGVGMSAQPPRFLRDGDALETTIHGIGSLRQSFAAASELTGAP
ncbi:fumarylacetoacetate hydrolase family protein [Microbacterium sp.]|jgi:2-keto-4-pentenoate hydratase/2-oxohepta-3-ene-1,7-dioic acid hydratase in catechol pathway|uniref:fumarylacetoacetate hydrolase family protein n=1 Tax=Microbacterium sp. TaxID=51671 RepID=UPI0037C77143